MMKNILLVNPFDKIPGENFRDQRYTYLYSLMRGKARIRWVSSDFHHWSHRKRCREKIPSAVRPDIILIGMIEYRHNLGLCRLISYFFYSLRAMRAIMRISPVPDVILCMAPVELMFMLALYARFKKITYIIDILDTWPDLFSHALPRMIRWCASVLLFPYYLMSFLTCRLATHITAVSRTYKEWAMRRGRRHDCHNASYYYLGCVGGSKRYNFRKPNDKLICLFAGQFGYNYDIETMIEAARILKNNYEDRIELILAGDGYKLPEMKRSAADLKNVRFTHWISTDQLEKLARKCHVGLCCYIEGATQSVPTKLFDYMSMGLYIVNSLPGEAAELIVDENIGENYRAGDPQKLAAILAALSSNIKLTILTGYRSWRLSREKYRAELIYKNMISELIFNPTKS